MRANQRAGFQGCSWALFFAVAWGLSGGACGSLSSSPPATKDGSAGSGGIRGDAAADMPAAGGATVVDSGGSDATDACVGDACNCPDSDLDGFNDCVDGCPSDYYKNAPGICGCGIPDTDSDGDNTPDCMDLCPMDPKKTAPLVCGCGKPDVDSDGDHVLDCNDGCPKDVTKTVPGVCGCGAPATLALPCLRHRYSFGGTGTVVTDTAPGGNANGTVMNAMLSGAGTLVLAGVATDQYVSLPANIISSLGDSATFEAWINWTGMGGPWQRIFDFGSNDGNTPGLQGANGTTYLFVTPSNTINTHIRAAFTVAGPPAEVVVNGPTALPWPTQVHVAVVIDGTAKTITLYQNGQSLGTSPLVNTTLSGLNDVNNWLGRSQFSPDEEFQGTYTEFRIYSSVRSMTDIGNDFAAGPDAPL
jgi:Concanavalin A-like lectin/glucanases superfamily